MGSRVFDRLTLQWLSIKSTAILSLSTYLRIMESLDLLLLCLAAFGAGFVDSIVGGGGLIQLPALMMILPQYPVVALLGTNKLVSVSGTAFSAYRFSKHVPFTKSVILPAVISAFICSFLGAYCVTLVAGDFLRPVFLLLLVLVFILTIRNKSFGLSDHVSEIQVALWKPLAIGALFGFYDGFFGPGTGTFLIIAFVGILGMTFVYGSAHAKVINLTTNVAALLLFAFKGSFLIYYALPMMLFNIMGAVVGVRLALLKGNTFVRGLLRAIVLATILRFGFQLLNEYLN
jgi:uncharacterized membrane protein YfcA